MSFRTKAASGVIVSCIAASLGAGQIGQGYAANNFVHTSWFFFQKSPAKCDDNRVNSALSASAKGGFVRQLENIVRYPGNPTALLLIEFWDVVETAEVRYENIGEISYNDQFKQRRCVGTMKIYYDIDVVESTKERVKNNSSVGAVHYAIDTFVSELLAGDYSGDIQLEYSISLNSNGESVIFDGAERFVVK